ncbi:MAG: transposase [Chitinophagaceae bacterium]
MARPGLLAQIVIDKYVDHLPLYRQQQRFAMENINIPYSTITDWVTGACKLILPLYDALQKEVLRSDYLHADETPIKVLDKDKKGQTHRGYFWVYHNSLLDRSLITSRDVEEKDHPGCSKISRGIYKRMVTRKSDGRKSMPLNRRLQLQSTYLCQSGVLHLQFEYSPNWGDLTWLKGA